MRSATLFASSEVTWPVLRDHLLRKTFPEGWKVAVFGSELGEIISLGDHASEAYANIRTSSFADDPGDGTDALPVPDPVPYFVWYNDRTKFLRPTERPSGPPGVVGRRS